MIIDTHAHIYHQRFDNDRNEMIQRARLAGVDRIILPAIDVASIHSALELADIHTGIYVMAALHPSEVKEATEKDLEAIAALVKEEKVVGVGESGLDYYWDRSFDQKQEAYLRWHIRLAIEEDLPLILHSRDKSKGEEVGKVMLEILKDESARHEGRLHGIFHCFGGPAWMVEEVMALGFLMGIGGTVTFKNSGVADIVKDIPLDALVLETDAPFLAPAPYRGKRNEPAYTRLVAEKLAEIKGISLEEVAARTTANAVRLFGL